jgi:hypothetical protein
MTHIPNDVTACTGHPQHGGYQCPQAEQCQRHIAWLDAAIRDGLLTMSAHPAPCPHHIPRRRDEQAA